MKKKTKVAKSPDKFTAVVLAAGKGTRMKSAQPKVLYDLMGNPLIYYVLRALLSLNNCIDEIVVVLGYKGSLVEKILKEMFPDTRKIKIVYQEKLLGTADAVKVALGKVNRENVLILCGDAPLITSKTIKKFISFFLNKKTSGCVLTAGVQEQNSLGAILRDSNGKVKEIKEKCQLNSKQINSREAFISEEVNSGMYCFNRKYLSQNLSKIKINAQKREYFFTDMIKIAYEEKNGLLAYFLSDSQEVLGVNTPKDLLLAGKVMRERVLDELINRGVKLVDFQNVFIEVGAKIGKNTVIYPFTFIEKDVIIGSNCSLGPFVRIRKGTRIKNNTCLGNFLEINRSQIGKNVKVKHFGYLGDVFVEDRVNIGAGSVVANYDGKNKHKSRIGKEAFIGSNAVLISPVKIGKQAIIGAGSVVTKDVLPSAVVVGVPARPLKKNRG